uniref:Uncharacterized protein n=1 Tax=Ditylum brightwellii TaxID=49249 RepID=A0A7S4RXS2_9STRA
MRTSMTKESGSNSRRMSVRSDSALRKSLKEILPLHDQFDEEHIQVPVLEQDFNLASKNAFKQASAPITRRNSISSNACSTSYDCHSVYFNLASKPASAPSSRRNSLRSNSSSTSNDCRGVQSAPNITKIDTETTVKDIISDHNCWADVQQKIKSARLVTSLGVSEVLSDYIVTHAEGLEQMKEMKKQIQKEMQKHKQIQRQPLFKPEKTAQNVKRRLSCVMGL